MNMFFDVEYESELLVYGSHLSCWFWKYGIVSLLAYGYILWCWLRKRVVGSWKSSLMLIIKLWCCEFVGLWICSFMLIIEVSYWLMKVVFDVNFESMVLWVVHLRYSYLMFTTKVWCCELLAYRSLFWCWLWYVMSLLAYEYILWCWLWNYGVVSC